MRLDSVKRILSGFFNDGIDTAASPAYTPALGLCAGCIAPSRSGVTLTKSTIIFSLAGTLATAIPLGLRFRPRITARCHGIVTEPAKALKSLAPQLKNRFTSYANFYCEHSSGRHSRRVSQDSSPAPTPAGAATRPPSKGGSCFPRRELCSSSQPTLSAPAHQVLGTAIF